MKNYNNLTVEGQQKFIDIIIENLEYADNHNETLSEIYRDGLSDLHHKCFNEGYFIIGYYQANKFIEDNFSSTFDAIDIVKEYEIDNFGEFNTQINSEAIANMLAYIIGEEIIYSIDEEKKVKNVIKYLKQL